MFICPNCSSKLNQSSKTWCCDNNHSFDVTKQGSVNLLLPQQKRSFSPGDSKEMVSARQGFLQTDIYSPIAEKLAQLIQCFVTPHQLEQTLTIADAGCGEGYYLRKIQQLALINHKNPIHYIGWDISKYATHLAAKSQPESNNTNYFNWVTASNANIPLENQSMDILMSNFGFNVIKEFDRVLNKKGCLITADVGKNHLIEIREIIYPFIKPYREKPSLENHVFKRVKNETLTYQSTLNKNQLTQLLLMTPHFFRTKTENKNQLMSLEKVNVTIDVVFNCYLKY